MAPSGKGNKGGKAVKEENEKVKASQQKVAAEKKEAETWKDGAKSKDNSKEEKRLADLARKQEAARLLAEEEKSLASKPKPKPTGKPTLNRSNVPATVKAADAKTDKKKAADKPAPPAAGKGTLGAGSAQLDGDKIPEPKIKTTSADDDLSLDKLKLADAKPKAADGPPKDVSVGKMAQSVESHPERRFKAALEAYIDAELPQYKKDYPGLRLVQYKERLFKQFQKHPDNPYNQLTAAYNTTRDGKIDIYMNDKEEREAALRAD